MNVLQLVFTPLSCRFQFSLLSATFEFNRETNCEKASCLHVVTGVSLTLVESLPELAETLIGTQLEFTETTGANSASCNRTYPRANESAFGQPSQTCNREQVSISI